MPGPYMGLTAAFLNSVDGAVHGFTQSAYQAVVQAHQTEIHLVLVLYIAVFGYLVLTGALEFSIMRAARHVLILCLVTSLATHWDIFALFFNDVFTDGPAKLIGALTGGSYDPNSMLGDVFDKGIIAANQINNGVGISTLWFFVIGTSVFFGTLIVVAFALFLIVLSKFALAVLLGLAPFFFILLLFSSTKDFFAQYVRQVFNFAMIPVFTAAILSLALKTISQALERLNAVLASHTGRGGIECLYVLICLAVLWLLLNQVMGLASGVAGGLQLHHGNAAGVAARVANTGAGYLGKKGKDNFLAKTKMAPYAAGWLVGKGKSVLGLKEKTKYDASRN